MAVCGQCGREAIYQLAGGQLLCAYCWSMIQQNQLAAASAAMAMINYYSDVMADTVGLPRTGPHIDIPTPTIIQGGAVNLNTVNNIHIEPGSQVGQLNAAAIIRIDRAVSLFNKAGNAKLAQSLQAFAQAVIDNNQLSQESQKRILSALEFLAVESAKRPETQNKSVFRTVLESVGPLVNAASAIAAQWENLRQLLDGLIGPA